MTKNEGNLTNEKKCGMLVLTEKENHLIEILRVIPYGQVVVYLEQGNPVRIEQIRESIKL